MSVYEKELNDYLDSIKGVLDEYVTKLVKEKYQELYSMNVQLITENQRLRQKLKEHQIIWEK